MKEFLPILFLVCSVALPAWGQARSVAPATPPMAPSPTPAKSTAPAPSSALLVDKDAIENADKAKSIIEQGIKALGGDTYLTIRDREMQGRGYGFHAGRATGSGGVFWSFTEFPDKERVELTKDRDVAELYVGDRGYELTYKGPHPIEPKDLDDYLRRRRFSLDTVLRTWVNDPSVILLFNGNAIAAQHSAYSVTLVNSKDESVTIYFDTDTHLPVKKSFEWRDPVDRQKNLEEEIYDDYKPVSGIMAAFNLSRYFNGDMASQRFLNSVTINQGLDPAMFNPNSGYNPNKQEKSKKR
ncbi:MAG: hypothetical protein WAM79_20025 [Candidatus Sulfotelmatobacter sp.]